LLKTIIHGKRMWMHLRRLCWRRAGSREQGSGIGCQVSGSRGQRAGSGDETVI
jgi:hypothetical protein